VSAGGVPEEEGGNVEILRRFINYMADTGLGAEIDKLVSYLHPDIEWYPGMIPLEKEVYRGHDEYREYSERLRGRGAEGSYLNVDEVRAVSDDLVLAFAWVHYEGAEGQEGPPFDSEYALLARFEDGLIREMRSFLTRAEAERAAENA
jgi:ketosteroid isomerase-like protein